MPEVAEDLVANGDIEVFVRHLGSGPLVLLCHGFPETSICWQRHLVPLSAAGYHAAAIDLRGMGRTSVPQQQAAYSILAVVEDLVTTANALGHDRFHVVGNDIGALLAWNTALIHPESVLSVTGLSLPFFARASLPPLDLLAFLSTPTETPYLLRFLEPDAHVEMETDPRGWVEGCIGSISGLVDPDARLTGMVPLDGPMSSVFVDDVMPRFLTDDERDDLGRSYERTGFAGALQWYHRINADYPLLEPWAESKIDPPSQFIGGDADPVRLISAGGVNELPYVTADLRNITMLENVGHWPHLEAPGTVRELMLNLFDSVTV